MVMAMCGVRLIDRGSGRDVVPMLYFIYQSKEGEQNPLVWSCVEEEAWSCRGKNLE